MSAIRPLWGDEQDRRSLTGSRSRGQVDASDQHDQTPRRFRARPVEVLAMCHDGSWAQAEAIAAWVTMEGRGAGDAAYAEPVDGRVVVLVLQAGEPDALWVLGGQHLVRDRHHAPPWRVYGAAEFESSFAPMVRELPIYADGEVA
jgi:hypothetical protein